VPDRKAVHLLDLGCGPGACTWFMAREGFAVSGIDGSATAIARTKTRLTGEALQAHLHVGNFASLPWPDSFFDAAVDNASLYATPIDNARQAVNEVSRVLKPHGFFLSAAFSDRTWGYGQGPEVEPGGFAQVSEGPLANKGFCRFLSQSQLASFYAPLEILSAETTSYSL